MDFFSRRLLGAELSELRHLLPLSSVYFSRDLLDSIGKDDLLGHSRLKGCGSGTGLGMEGDNLLQRRETQ